MILWLYYKFASCVDDSWRYAIRANDKPHKRRLAGGKKIFCLYEVNPHNILEVVDEAHGLFRMTSESIEGLWYYVSLTTHFCGCPSKSSSYRFLVGLKMILKTHNPLFYMNDDKESSSEVNVGEDVVHINANFGEHLPTTNSDVEFTTTDLKENLFLNIFMKMYIHQHHVMNKNNYSSKVWRSW